MAIFKCKMCGGTLEINPGESVATCEYCGSQQTLPKLDDDRKENLYDRANHFRRNNEFDKAAGIYEQILNEDKLFSIWTCRKPNSLSEICFRRDSRFSAVPRRLVSRG